jgi:2-oxoglutarate ferredoxin oxidoreductase subunit alpha
MPPEWYVPYEDNARGVPLMGIFGDGYRYHVTGLIHDVRGFPTQRPDEIVPFMNRLFRKIYQHFFDIQMVAEESTGDAEILVIAYGSVARSARRAVRDARERGIKAGLLQLITLWPFPRQIVEPLLRQVRTVLIPELNMGQMSREVKRINQGVTRIETLNRIDGNLITPQEILVRLLKM